MIGKKAFIYPTMRCNLKCSFCYTSSPIKQQIDFDELTIREYEKLIKDLYNNGVRVFDMSGGEPLFREDLMEICTIINSYDDTRIYITSNGTQIERKRIMMPELLEKIDRINISLDSIYPEIHDELRGVKKTHEKAMTGIEILCSINPKKVGINFVLNAMNFNELPEMVDLCIKSNIAELAVLFPKDVAANKLVNFYPSYDEYKEILIKLVEQLRSMQDLERLFSVWMLLPAYLFNLIVELEKDYTYSSLSNPKLTLEVDPFKGCQAYHDFIAVTVNGDIVGCPFMTNLPCFKVGNVREVDMDILVNKCDEMHKKIKQRGKTLRKTEECSNCNTAYLCQGGCPAMSVNYYGEMSSKDLICNYIKKGK